MIRTVTLAILLSWPLSAAAAPQAPLPSVESVVVTGTKSPQAMSDFVGEVAAPTRVAGKLARWDVPVCVQAYGLNTSATTFVRRRIHEVAAGAGARVDRDPGCRPNVRIVFTTQPQALVNSIRKTDGNLMGYYDSIAQLDRRAVFQGPIQTFYMTATRDQRGHQHIDSGRVDILEMLSNGSKSTVMMPNAVAYSVAGTRLGDGLRANLRMVTIIADPTKLLDYEMGTVADYLAMTSLSQMTSTDRCQSLPSISNLLAANCPRVPAGLSDIDLGYLRGLYHLDAERARGVQVHQIVYQMRREVLKDSE